MKRFFNFIASTGVCGTFFAAACADGNALGLWQIVLLLLLSCAMMCVGTYFNRRGREV